MSDRGGYPSTADVAMVVANVLGIIGGLATMLVGPYAGVFVLLAALVARFVESIQLRREIAALARAIRQGGK